MTSTQPNLHTFFKARRSARTAALKNTKLKGDSVQKISSKPIEKIPVVETERDITQKRKREDEEDGSINKRRKETVPEKNIKERSNEVNNSETSNKEANEQKIKKKPTPEELKALLGKCNRLDELRSRLVKATKCNDRLKAFQNEIIESNLPPSSRSPCKKAPHPQLESFSSIEVDVPVSPGGSQLKSPLKTPIKSPAYLKYADLTAAPSTDLVLPSSYSVLKKTFITMDRICSMLYNRVETITFSKLRTSVQEAMKKGFHLTHIGQIKFVYENAYKYFWEKIKGSGMIQSSGNYELVIKPNLETKEASVAKNLSNMFDNKPEPPKPKFVKMDNVILIKREHTFHNLLLGILKQHHMEYMKNLEPPIICDESKIKRWHPGFLLADIPEVELAELPKPPVVEKIDNAQDMLARARDVFAVNPKMLNAVETAASKVEVSTPKKPEAPKPVDKNPALKGISSSLLAKIRAREAEKTSKEMTRSKDQMDELERISRLPALVRIIRSLFVSENKAALTWEFVANKLVDSHGSIKSTSEVDVHLNLLFKEIPNWCTVHKIRSGTYLKIDKNRQVNEIVDKLNTTMKNY